ncbi:MAG TPA: pitrilysin family protein [Acidobacteriaceae bacterium]|nr:pitrilysin family protein [Acidobacteriaceae bacterium]
MKILTGLKMTAAMALLAAMTVANASAQDAKGVVRETLGNGLRVVVIHNSLAAVATVQMNFMVGGNETPAGFPGDAHALEHMAFRGCTGMTADQTAAIYAQLGGQNNADTQQNITQFFATVPAADIDVALHAQASCLRGVDVAPAEWAQEKGAIIQEVQRDLSNPTYKLISRLNEDMFAGTPYAHDPLGTRPSFDATTAQMLSDFYKQWYTPGNAILVIVGDVDAAATLAKVKELFGDIKDHPLPARPEIKLGALKQDTFSLDSNLPYVVGAIAYRLPGTESPDYAATQILADVLASRRADLYAMVPAGKALAAQFEMGEQYAKAGVGFGVVVQPAGTDATASIAEMRAVLNNYAAKGVPEDLVIAAKRSEVAEAEFQRNSIPGLADVWSAALAGEGRQSPDEDVEALKKVTLADVDRVAKEYLTDTNSITATLKPVPDGEAVSAKGFGGAESLTAQPTKPVVLPVWAEKALSGLKVPAPSAAPSDVRLPNGIRLIVKTDTTSKTVSVVGSVKHNPDLETGPGKEGVSEVLEGLFSYGTQTLDRLAFQKALDDISASENAGYNFGLRVLRDDFPRGMELLADNELHPALPAQAFAVVKQQTSQFVAGSLVSPGYRTQKALEVGLLPVGDPELRETTPATLAKVELDDVKQYYAATVRPDLTTIVVIGDITPAEARVQVEKWFGDWKATGPKPDTDLKAIVPNKASAADVADSTAVQDTVVLAEQLDLNRLDPDYYPLQLGNHVLGGGFYATRLYHDLRQVAGYVYSVDVGMQASKTRATYEVSYGCDPQNVSKARGLIQRDLDQMRTTPVSAEELHQAKALLLRQLPLSEASQAAVAGGLLARAQAGLPLDEPFRAASKYVALNAEDVKAAFARKVRPGDFVQVVRGPTPQ